MGRRLTLGWTPLNHRLYLRNEVRRIKGAPADEPSFRALDLNQPLSPAAEMIFSPDDLRGCFTDTLPNRKGPCFVGFDFGEATSGTAAAAIWPESGRTDLWLAFGDEPNLKARGLRDDAAYTVMFNRGELKTYSGRVVKPADFLTDIRNNLEGCDIKACAADGYKDARNKRLLGPRKYPLAHIF